MLPNESEIRRYFHEAYRNSSDPVVIYPAEDKQDELHDKTIDDTADGTG